MVYIIMSRATGAVIHGHGSKIGTLHRNLIGSGIGGVLLDHGLGGQSSYASPQAYTQATGRKIDGSGLSDKISNTLKNLNISKPQGKVKRKNITLSL
jgi:hypothetical protein